MAISIFGGDGGGIASALEQMHPGFTPTIGTGLTAAQTAGSSSAFMNTLFIDANATSIGYANRWGVTTPRGGTTSGGINWTRPVAVAARIAAQDNFQTQCVFRLNMGLSTTVLGTPNARSIGVRFGASATNTPSALVLEVHDGTTLTAVTTSFTPTFNQAFDVIVYSDGTGNAYCYVNGNLVGSSSAAPSTAASAGQSVIQVGLENTSIPTVTSRAAVYNLKFLSN